MFAYFGWRIRTPSLGPMKLTWAKTVRKGLPAAFSISSRIRDSVEVSVGCSDDGAGVDGAGVVGAVGVVAGRLCCGAG